MAVPESVLFFEGDKVFVEKETSKQKFERVQIKAGLSDGINIEVKEGISKTDKLKVPQAKAFEPK